MDPDSEFRRRLIRSEDFVGRQVADEYVLVPLRRHASECACIYTLNPVAGRIWELLNGERDLSAVVEILCDEFEVDAQDAARDLPGFVGQLQEIAAVRVI